MLQLVRNKSMFHNDTIPSVKNIVVACMAVFSLTSCAFGQGVKSDMLWAPKFPPTKYTPPHKPITRIADLLARHGAVHPEVAAAMAAGARARLAATVGAATTGVAGPDPSDGQPVGTVYIAVSAGRDSAVRALTLTGDRHRIRVATVGRSLELLIGALKEDNG